jgi:hypothetical protein
VGFLGYADGAVRQPEVAAVLAERALARASLRTTLNKAQIQLGLALLRKDETARGAALAEPAGAEAGPQFNLQSLQFWAREPLRLESLGRGLPNGKRYHSF